MLAVYSYKATTGTGELKERDIILDGTIMCIHKAPRFVLIMIVVFRK